MLLLLLLSIRSALLNDQLKSLLENYLPELHCLPLRIADIIPNTYPVVYVPNFLPKYADKQYIC